MTVFALARLAKFCKSLWSKTMSSPGYKAPSTSTFGQIRGPIVDSQGNVRPDFQRYLAQLEAKTNQSLSVAGNTVLNNIARAVPTTSGPTTSSGGYVLLPEMSVTITTKGNPVLILFVTEGLNTVAIAGASFILKIDSSFPSSVDTRMISPGASTVVSTTMVYLDTPLPGSHTYQIWWAVINGGQATSSGLSRSLLALELG